MVCAICLNDSSHFHIWCPDENEDLWSGKITHCNPMFHFTNIARMTWVDYLKPLFVVFCEVSLQVAANFDLVCLSHIS